mmetsp:Transcript_8351/g.23939  ORF Transcript_8351/g.23939 Transcript_8351/m.23939 type:complete len:202 (+) Transcript_8351:768-1373(+)
MVPANALHVALLDEGADGQLVLWVHLNVYAIVLGRNFLHRIGLHHVHLACGFVVVAGQQADDLRGVKVGVQVHQQLSTWCYLYGKGLAVLGALAWLPLERLAWHHLVVIPKSARYWEGHQSVWLLHLLSPRPVAGICSRVGGWGSTAVGVHLRPRRLWRGALRPLGRLLRRRLLPLGRQQLVSHSARSLCRSRAWTGGGHH